MEYWVPASITLDGFETTVGWELSATDKEFIRRWYPAAPTPAVATGLLRTDDDCDEIDFRVDYGIVNSADVGLNLTAASGLTWWKAFQVPIGAADYKLCQMQNGAGASGTVPRSSLDSSRPIRFHKAKLFGVHTMLGYTWDVTPALPGGSGLSLTWKRDRC